ncbi:MAG: NADH-quinone oxidoreductase subunit N [Bdellovibrio sp. CG10_big_fil_rev_8_21_14_0_10_47_8]|nr:MAG: NADH-quinone oxidoreductase subunit N [Bdellovibrio sp. CG10_big_fil_rev_8_21_14_0_10_47_8]
MSIGIGDILLVSPMIMLFLASIIPITIKVLRGNIEQSPSATLIQGLGGLFAAIVLLMVVSGSGATAFANALVFDGVTKWMGFIALLAAAGSLLLMYDNPSTTGDQFSELVFLTLSSAIGMLILVSAVDLLMVFIGLETMSLALYLMIAMSHEQKLSKEAALKYFILGSFASAIFLYGIAFIFGSVGSTYIPVVIQKTSELITSSRIYMFGITMLILGFCFKVSIVPFHAWTPDVYQGAPTPHTAYMSTAVKAVSFAAFLRIIATKSLVGSENLFDLLQWLAVITMIVGNVGAILQNNFKRMLAYSSVAHSGYLLVGVITTGISDDMSFGATGVIFYLAAYTLMTLGAFAVVTLMEKSEETIINVDDLAGYAKKRPLMALCLTLFLLSLAGIPPTVGFFGKFYMFTAAIGEGLIWLAIWGVINSVISVYYYLRPIVVMYMREGGVDEAPHSMNATRTAIIVSAILVAFLGFISGPIFELVERALS